MSVSVETGSYEVTVITQAARGTGFMTLVPARERNGKLVLGPRGGELLTYVERVVSTGHN